MAFQQVDLGSDECGMSSLPDKVEIPLATVRDATAFYIVKTATPDGRSWAVQKRFSHFEALRKALMADPQSRVEMEKLAFPAKKMFGGADAAVVKQRKDTLNGWMNEVLRRCPTDKNVAMFLAQDHSVSNALLENIGLGHYMPGVDGSQDATKATLSLDDYATPGAAAAAADEAEPDFMAMSERLLREREEEAAATEKSSLAFMLANDPNAPPGGHKFGEGDGGGGGEGVASDSEEDLDDIMNRFMNDS